MANQNRSLNDRLRELKTYTETIKKASKWEGSGETISHASTGNNDKNIREYIYEFYCYIRILNDLIKNYDLAFVPGTKHKNHFPKSPGNKGEFPYFSVLSKDTGEEIFQICAGINIIGQKGATSAPDISFLQKATGLQPNYNDIEMLFDAKFKHNEDGKIAKGQFNDVFAMIFNLDCMKQPTNPVLFNEFVGALDLNGNCILTNGKAYSENIDHHQMHHIKVVEKFEIGQTIRIVG